MSKRDRHVIVEYVWHYVGAVLAVLLVLFIGYSAIKIGTGAW